MFGFFSEFVLFVYVVDVFFYCHLFILFSVERWQETALLVFSALALRVGKNQMCCLCGGLFVCCPTVVAMSSWGYLARTFQFSTYLYFIYYFTFKHLNPNCL